MAFQFLADISDETGTVSQSLLSNLMADADAALSDWSRYITGIGTLVAQINITNVAPASGQGSATENGGATTYVQTGSLDGRTIFEPSSLYELQTGTHFGTCTSDITVNIDLNYLNSFLYAYPDPTDPSTTIPSDKVDAVSVFIHEFGHGLGILSTASPDGTIGPNADPFDTHIQENSDGTADFTGPNAGQVYGGPVPLTTSNRSENYSHLANSLSDPLARDVMNGLTFYEGQKYQISDVDLAILKDVGANVTSWVEGPSEPAQHDTAPVLSGITASASLAAGGSICPFAGIGITDPDQGQVETVTVAFSPHAGGTLSNLGAGSYDAATGTYSDSGTAAAVTTDLRGLVFAPGPVSSGAVATPLTLTASDGYLTTSGTVTVTGLGQPSYAIAATDADKADGLSGGATNYVFTVTRSGDASAAATLTYTVAGSGTNPVPAGQFASPGGTVGFAAGATTAALDVAVSPARITAPEGFTVTLSGPAGTVIATPTASGTVEPDIGPNDLIVHGAHADYSIALNPAGGAIVQDQVSGRDGTHTLPTLHDVVFTDGIGRFDATGNAEEAARLYKAALGRAPDSSGLDYWTGILDNGTLPLSQVAASFVTSAEFGASYGALDNTGFVNQLYRNVLNRTGDATGVQTWVAQLNAGASRAQVLLGFSDSAENKDDTAATIGDKDRGEAYRLYQAAFNRTPDAAGLNYWTGALDQGGTPQQIAQGFATSAEFQQDFASAQDPAGFVNQLYRNVLHRAGDAAGVQYWTAALSSGAQSRAQVLLGFSDSAENRLDTASATHDGWVFLANA